MGRRFLTTTAALRPASSNLPKGSESATGILHTPDSYAKEVDYTPAPDHRIYRVDPLSENVQKPYEAPSSDFSRTGAAAGFAAMCFNFESAKAYVETGPSDSAAYLGAKS
ncbi:hypothetical protein NP233_g838 [Leucocoprinus birnbaumii]|uniref:Uncharacterized protein n=1 Tax=Leucocoprinus birnbaumii TaxID=56174 RepID=A0AAD5YWE0_9AGAR|nr:hypothetical protein NP233_g838 [Leucocoprinus birnbaumii]